jgi:chromate transporter
VVSTTNERKGSAAEVGAAFLKLGLTSFGGPIAHLGYFRREFVERRRWIDEEHFGQLLGLCQFLPGPASSQLGFSLGLLRAGWPGALAAFVGFTLPSALLMFAFAVSNEFLSGALGGSAVHGLKLVAVAVVAQGVLGMARTLTPDPPRAMMAAVSAGLVVVSGSAWMQLVVVAGGALLGPWLCRQASGSAAVAAATSDLATLPSATVGTATSGSPAMSSETSRSTASGSDILASVTPRAPSTLPYGRRLGAVLLLSFVLLLTLALFIAPTTSPTGQVAGAFFRAGALVFGGGHVVLPLLEHSVVDPGWIDNGTFLAGYGAAQALPGPMFTFAAFLGERLHYGPGGISGAIVGLLAIFLPGFLIVAGVLPYWQTLSTKDTTARSLAGVNAAVVGLLAAALYDPVWVSTVKGPSDFAIALIGFVLLVSWKWPAWAAVLWCVLASTLRGLF